MSFVLVKSCDYQCFPLCHNNSLTFSLSLTLIASVSYRVRYLCGSCGSKDLLLKYHALPQRSLMVQTPRLVYSKPIFEITS